MKTLLLIIVSLFAAGLSDLPQPQQASVKYANVTIDGKNTNELLRKPIQNIEAANLNETNAFYVTEGSKIKLYVMNELPKPVNANEIMAAVDALAGQSNARLNEDQYFSLEKKTRNGDMSIDLWGHSRKVVDVNGKQVLLITAEQLYVAPNTAQHLYFTFLDGNYSLKTTEKRKAYLVYRQIGKTPLQYPDKVWTDGASSVIKVGMGSAEVQQINFLNKIISLSNYPAVGFIDLAATAKSRPNASKIYLVKYLINGIRCAVPVQITPSDGQGPIIVSCPCSPVIIRLEGDE